MVKLPLTSKPLILSVNLVYIPELLSLSNYEDLFTSYSPTNFGLFVYIALGEYF